MKELNCWVGCFGLLEKKSNNGRVLPLTYDMDFKKGPDAFFICRKKKKQCGTLFREDMNLVLKIWKMKFESWKLDLANFVPGVLCSTKVQESFSVPTVKKVG